jgi:hypothetical protein
MIPLITDELIADVVQTAGMVRAGNDYFLQKWYGNPVFGQAARRRVAGEGAVPPGWAGQSIGKDADLGVTGE